MKRSLLLVAVVVGCHSEPPSKYPAREPGCDVLVFPERPGYNVDNIGPVNAACDDTISDEDCLRTLKDQVCKIGGDTVWGVDEKPEVKNGKKRLAGRAAHRR